MESGRASGSRSHFLREDKREIIQLQRRSALPVTIARMSCKVHKITSDNSIGYIEVLHLASQTIDIKDEILVKDRWGDERRRSQSIFSFLERQVGLLILLKGNIFPKNMKESMCLSAIV